MTPLRLEDFGLSPDEMKEIVLGAQKFLPPVDATDDVTPVDTEPEPPTS